jgi:hypothetical protein
VEWICLAQDGHWWQAECNDEPLHSDARELIMFVMVIKAVV